MIYKNFEDVITGFINEYENGSKGNLYYKGNLLIHYNTTIAERTSFGFILNTTRYSIQTGRIQKLLKEKIPPEKIIKKLVKIPKDTRTSLNIYKKIYKK